MGLDFIRRTAGKPFQKAWKDGLNRVTMPTLFPVEVESARVVTARLLSERRIAPGQDVIVQIQGAGLSICEGNQPIAIVETPPSGVFSAIVNTAGVAAGTIERVGTFGDTVEVRIR